MSNNDILVIKEFVSEESLSTHESIIEADTDLYAKYIAEGLIFSFKKSQPQFRKDKIIVLLNRIIYRFNCLLWTARRDVNFERSFDITISFIEEFRAILKEIETILSEESINCELVADIYLYYFAILNIYNRVFNRFDDELRKEELQAKDISFMMPSHKSLDDNVADFNKVSELIRALKQNN